MHPVTDRARGSRSAPAAPRPAGLSTARVAYAALDLIDRNGLAALSMRGLAAELGVEAMSLYKHVANKADLLDQVVAVAVADLDLPDTGPWQERCRTIAHEYRRMGLAHPDVFALVATCRSGALETLQPIEASLAALRSAGFDDATAVHAFRLLLAYVNGAVQGQIADEAAAAELSSAGLAAAVDAGIVAPTLTNVVELADRLAAPDHADAFGFGLDCILDALQSRR